MVRMNTLGAVSMLSLLKSNSPSGKNDKVSSEVNAICLKDKHTANNEDPLSIITHGNASIHSQYKININPNNCQPSLKNLSCTDNERQSHKSLNERTSVTSPNNNVESLPSIYFTRPTCGNTYTTKAPKRCGISMTIGNKIVTISYTDL